MSNQQENKDYIDRIEISYVNSGKRRTFAISWTFFLIFVFAFATAGMIRFGYNMGVEETAKRGSILACNELEKQLVDNKLPKGKFDFETCMYTFRNNAAARGN